jgi:hypothetical protein
MKKQLLDRIFRAIGQYPADAWKLKIWYGQILDGVDTDSIKCAMRRYPEIPAQQGVEPRIYD